MATQGNRGGAVRRLRTSMAALAVGLLAAGQAPAASNQVDVMFVYTPQAAQWAGNIQTRLNQYIAQSNQAYQVSGVDIALRMVHSVQSNHSSYYYTNNNALNHITYNDGAIHALRDDHGADFVGLLNMSPGGLCGLGWLGTSSGGTITAQSKALAYSSSAIDCGYLTFTHELGHNMGLMHSRRQGDTSGGHHVYGMGYGVDNSFATLMAYAYLFNTNYVYRFSNPRQNCNGYACGNATTGDASRSLSLMANQYPTYRPSRDGDPGEPGGPADPVRTIELPAGNVLQNPSFEGSLSNWSGVFDGSLSLSSQRRYGGQQGLTVGNRTSYASGVAQDVTGKLQAGIDYEFSLWMRLQGRASDTARVVLEVNGGQSYVDLGRFGATDQWSRISGSFTHALPANASVRLLVYGPAAGVGFHLDSLSLNPAGDDGREDNQIRNGDFETGTAASWGLGFGGQLQVSSDGYRNGYSLQLVNRGQWYDSIAQELTGLVPGTRYRANAQVKVEGANDTVSLWLLIQDASGWHWERIGWVNAGNGQWATLAVDEFAFQPVGQVQSVSLHFMGPAPGVRLKIDDVSLVRVP
ncbi:carbohydrate binding domain-containing protein [Luteimonas arsenica]|uniref:carbohydrate binding domain-containing protein n=1 Tax=Luteimonas arsenica TaxID=1586242 RepID=UPI001055F868|nr:carbohydrate binding domain-containing protein [Luteimonas arsenica]